jgi:molybdate transport system substrate-binding protein
VLGSILAFACAGKLPEGETVVFAAASLTDAFEEMGESFEGSHPGAGVIFNFAGSHQLAGQIVQGAPADVFASANSDQMEIVAGAGLLTGEPLVFASNRLVIVVEPGNPWGLTNLSDLAHPQLTVVLASEDVPAGRYSRQALQLAGVEVTPASLEADVRAVLAKVALGEADAGIVYHSDIVAAGSEVETIGIAESLNVAAVYPIATLAAGSSPDRGRAFVDLVLSEAGSQILERYGLGPP